VGDINQRKDRRETDVMQSYAPCGELQVTHPYGYLGNVETNRLIIIESVNVDMLDKKKTKYQT
jgi:hypothetical protein